MLNKRECRKFLSPDTPADTGSGVFHAPQIGYVIRTAVKNLSHHRTLILYIYDCNQVSKKKPAPLWTMFQTRTDYITLECKPDGTAWRTCGFDRLGNGYGFTGQCAFYSQQDALRLAGYFHAEADGLKPLLNAQYKIQGQRSRERQCIRDKRVRSRMAGIPALPRNLKQRVHREIMPAYFFYDHRKGDFPTKGTCTSCGSEVVLSHVRHNAKGTCPRCGREVTMKPRGRIGNLYDRATCQTIQKTKSGELIVRIIKVYYTYKKGCDMPSEDIYENARIFLNVDKNNRFQYDSYYYSYSTKGWKRGCRPSYGSYQYCFEADTCAYVYLPNLETALRDTAWQYCPLKQFYGHFCQPMEVAPFMQAYLEHPKLEHLVKTGFYSLASDLAYRSCPGDLLDESKNRTHQILKIAAEDVGFLQSMDADMATLAAFQQYAAIKDRQRLLVWQMENKIQHNILPSLKYITVHKLIRYTTNQFQHLCNRKGQYGSLRYQKMQDVVTEYRDYLEMCRDLDYDMKNSFVLYPKDLQKAHDRVQKRIKIKENELIQKNFKDAMEAVADSRAFVSDGLKIVFPATPRDLETEGNALHHCVGRYVKSVTKKECMILFIRRCSDETKPFYTMEVRGQEIIQVRGMRNCPPTEEVTEFLDAYKRQVLQKLVNSAA